MPRSRADDELDIRRTLAEYCHRVDDADFEGVVSLFTPGGCFAYKEAEARGPAALLAFLEDLQGRPEQRGTHLTFNPVIDLDGDRAVVVSDIVFLRSEGGVLPARIVARYRDELACIDGQWRFERREVLLRPGPQS